MAFYSVCYLALMKELKGTEVLKWINRNLCDVYSHNGGLPLNKHLKNMQKQNHKRRIEMSRAKLEALIDGAMQQIKTTLLNEFDEVMKSMKKMN